MSATSKTAIRPPRPVEALIRGETADERITMIAIQVDQTMHVVEAMASVLMCLAHVLKDDEEKNPDMKLPEGLYSAFAQLDETLRGERT